MNEFEFFVGHRSIVDKSSANGAKGPEFKTWQRMKIYLCLCVFICSVKNIVINKRTPIGLTFYLKKLDFLDLHFVKLALTCSKQEGVVDFQGEL